MSTKTSLLALRPGLTLLTSLFMGGLALVGLASVPALAHATTITPTRNRGPDGILPYVQVGGQGDPAIRSSEVLTTYVYLPLIARAEVCQAIPDESYGDFSVNSDPTNPPAEEHPDLNLAMRGYEPTFNAVYQVYGWDWEHNRLGSLVTDPEVTMAGLAVTPGETIHVPDSGYTIGGGYEALVLYATPERITLKYTPDDHVIWGYTLHVENICVEPRLLALYQSWNEAGRGRLPALRAGQAFGRARGSEIGVVIRDNGAFMDPRSRKDWWQGR
jgi:hypothetical protein